jgi:hypothetical protein
MRRFLAASIVTLAAAGALVGAATAATTTSSGGSGQRAELRTFLCQRALDPGQRLVSVMAVMRPLKKTRRLELRFELLSKTSPTAAFTEVQGTGLGTFVSPTDPPTLGTRPDDVWRLSHPVADLPAPATYRFVVTFRWVGAHDRVIGTDVRESRPCYQPELRPDLVALSLVAQPIPKAPKKDLYAAQISDDGLTGAGPFQVEFTDGAIVKDHNVKHIAPHQILTFNFVGPLCDPTAPPTMTIDPDQQVDAYTRANNSLTATCPAPTPAS